MKFEMESQMSPAEMAIDVEKKEILETVIAELCSSAPNEDVKNCIRCYEHGFQIKRIIQDLMKNKKEKLEKTFEYLKRPNEVMPKTKPIIAHNIVCRIQNYLPETCDACKQTYRTMLANKHLLACAKCGQEMHHPCLLAKLQVTDVDSLNHEIVGHAINPLGLPGMHFARLALMPIFQMTLL